MITPVQLIRIWMQPFELFLNGTGYWKRPDSGTKNDV